jgi:hypothetical protein
LRLYIQNWGLSNVGRQRIATCVLIEESVSMNLRAEGSHVRISTPLRSPKLLSNVAKTGLLRTGLVRTCLFAAALCCVLPFALRTAGASAISIDTPAAGDGSPDTVQKSADSRAVRLSSVEGDVRVVQDGEVIADPALANLPLFEGSEITTANEGRAEIEFEDGTVVRLSPNTTVVLSVLSGQGTRTRTEIVMNGGLAYFELQPSTAEHSLLVHYDNATFTASSFSVIRLIDDTPPASLAVFSGNLHLERGDALQLDIHSGESVTFDAKNAASYNLSELIEPDSWDAWNSDRDELLNAESADKTAATSSLHNYQGVGLNDLDANGNWYNVPGQGLVWSPYDAQADGASWDPYGYGHWVFYPRFGYVWVSDYAWGYTPYQCGQWNFFDSFGWGWIPGGGCNPWWGLDGGGYYGAGYYGGGGWGFRLGNRPPGYRPPNRPLPGPVHPHPGPHPGPQPGHDSGHPPLRVRTGPVMPPVGVDRRTARSTDSTFVGRPAAPVVIAGQTVEPLRPLAPRQAYQQPGDTYVNRAAPPQLGGYREGARPANPGYTGIPYRPATRQTPQRPYSPPPSRPQPQPSYGGGGHMPSGGGSPPHSSPAPAPHK